MLCNCYFFSVQSPVFQWDKDTRKMLLVQEVDTSYPISVEHFLVRGRHYIVFANKFNFTTDSTDTAVSTVFRFDDSTGRLSLHQV